MKTPRTTGCETESDRSHVRMGAQCGREGDDDHDRNLRRPCASPANPVVAVRGRAHGRRSDRSDLWGGLGLGRRWTSSHGALHGTLLVPIVRRRVRHRRARPIVSGEWHEMAAPESPLPWAIFRAGALPASRGIDVVIHCGRRRTRDADPGTWWSGLRVHRPDGADVERCVGPRARCGVAHVARRRRVLHLVDLHELIRRPRAP
jgi:hypothetical protein